MRTCQASERAPGSWQLIVTRGEAICNLDSMPLVVHLGVLPTITQPRGQWRHRLGAKQDTLTLSRFAHR